MVSYEIEAGGEGSGNLAVEILDKNGNSVVKGLGMSGTLSIPNVKLWWPYSMSKQNFTEMYILKVSFFYFIYCVTSKNIYIT